MTTRRNSNICLSSFRFCPNDQMTLIYDLLLKLAKLQQKHAKGVKLLFWGFFDAKTTAGEQVDLGEEAPDHGVIAIWL